MLNQKQKVLILKRGRDLIVGMVSLIFVMWLTNLLDPLFTRLNQYLISKSNVQVTGLIRLVLYIFNINIPVYSVILFITVAWFIYKVGRRVMLGRRKFKIIKAEYGSGKIYVDITNNLNDFVVNNVLKITLSNGIPGFDPTPGIVKIAKIKYQLNNKIVEKRYVEGNLIDLP